MIKKEEERERPKDVENKKGRGKGWDRKKPKTNKQTNKKPKEYHFGATERTNKVEKMRDEHVEVDRAKYQR